MKILKYNLCTIINHGTEEEPRIEEVLSPVTMGWNEINEEIAKKEAYKGEYTIEDDGQPKPEPTPTTDYATYEELAEAFSQGVDSI